MFLSTFYQTKHQMFLSSRITAIHAERFMLKQDPHESQDIAPMGHGYGRANTQGNDENGNPLNAFGQMLAVIDVEDLIMFRRKLKEVGKRRMVKILTEEIEKRKPIAKNNT